jgi:prefoldin subunit 5
VKKIIVPLEKKKAKLKKASKVLAKNICRLEQALEDAKAALKKANAKLAAAFKKVSRI